MKLFSVAKIVGEVLERMGIATEARDLDWTCLPLDEEGRLDEDFPHQLHIAFTDCDGERGHRVYTAEECAAIRVADTYHASFEWCTDIGWILVCE